MTSLLTHSAPVEDSRRVHAMDVTRGFALLGIFMVNVQTFAEPFGRFLARTPESDDLVTQACFYIDKGLCEGKFYSLFSMLFGMGLILQMRSIESRAGRFVPVYLRRIAVLLVIGLIHALGLWYGDILVVYSFCGLILMLCRKWSARTHLIIAAVLVVAASVFYGGLSALDALDDRPPMPAAEALALAEAGVAEGRTPFFALMDAYGSRKFQDGPDHPLFIELERRAYHDGPALDAFLFRVGTWAFFIVFVIFGMGWHILAMFFLGSGLLKAGLFEPRGERLRSRLFVLGLTIGLPGSVVIAFLPKWGGGGPGIAALGTFLFIFAPMLSLGYLTAWTKVVESGRFRALTAPLSAAGRMALTNYLTQTIVSTAVFYWWGLAQFGEWTRGERCLYVVCVFAAQCAFSVVWMRFFRCGPVEWVWRCLTYLTLVPMRRAESIE